MTAKKPRKQQLTINTKPLAEPAYAVVRVSWYCEGKQTRVDEVQLEEGIENVEAVLETLIKNALQAGADVSVMTTAQPEQFGVAA
jgi:hypothetical protein